MRSNSGRNEASFGNKVSLAGHIYTRAVGIEYFSAKFRQNPVFKFAIHVAFDVINCGLPSMFSPRLPLTSIWERFPKFFRKFALAVRLGVVHEAKCVQFSFIDRELFGGSYCAAAQNQSLRYATHQAA